MKSGVAKKIASQPIYGPVVDHQLRLVARLEVARVRDGQPVRYITTVYAYSIEQDKSFQVSDGLSDVSNPVVRQERQVPVLPRLDRCRPGQGLVRAVERRHARDVGHLPRRPAERPGVAARARERRGEAGGSRTKKRRRRSPRQKPEDEAEAGADAGGEAAPAKDQPFRIDFEGLEYRILDLPIRAGGICRTCRPAPRARSTT